MTLWSVLRSWPLNCVSEALWKCEPILRDNRDPHPSLSRQSVITIGNNLWDWLIENMRDDEGQLGTTLRYKVGVVATAERKDYCQAWHVCTKSRACVSLFPFPFPS